MITVGLAVACELTLDVDRPIIVTDCLFFRELEASCSTSEWHDRKVTLIYYPGHQGISINEKADRLAVEDSVASSIAISFSDIKFIIYTKQWEVVVSQHCGSREVERMVWHGLRRGWIAKSRHCVGASCEGFPCHLACGTISHRTLVDVQSVRCAGAAWIRVFGSRSAREAAVVE